MLGSLRFLNDNMSLALEDTVIVLSSDVRRFLGHGVSILALACSLVTPLTAHAQDDRDAINTCLYNWKKHPFKKNPPYRTIAAKVKILGIGGDVQDLTRTDSPELVLIKPSVTVMAKVRYDLMNPNGWYCFKGKVTVLGKTEIHTDCETHLTSSQDSVAVMGHASSSGGVAVLGTMRVYQDNCPGGKGSDGSAESNTTSDNHRTASPTQSTVTPAVTPAASLPPAPTETDGEK
jgi:hypothetical protein